MTRKLVLSNTWWYRGTVIFLIYLRYWYQNIGTNDTYQGIEGIAQHYHAVI